MVARKARPRLGGPSGELTVSAAFKRGHKVGLNSFQARHHQNAGYEGQSEVLGLFDRVINFFDQYPGRPVDYHSSLSCFEMWRGSARKLRSVFFGRDAELWITAWR